MMNAVSAAPAAMDYFSSVRTEIGTLLPPKIGNILEIGCGVGATMAWLRANREIHYAAGVEIVATAGDQARQVFDAVEIGSIDDLPLAFPVQQFDVILALDVLEHLSWPDRTLEKLHGRLKPGGLFVSSIPNVANFCVSWPLFFQGQWNYTDEGQLDRTHLRFFSRRTALALFEDAGFTIAQVETTSRYPNIFRPFGWKGASARWYSKKLLDILPIPRHMLDSQYLISAKMPI